MGYDMYTVKQYKPNKISSFEFPNKFRANASGMFMLRNMMTLAKILDVKTSSQKFISVPEIIDDEDTDEWSAVYDHINKPVTGARSPNKDLVPIYKFYSNDGWHVVEEECIIIYKGLEKLLLIQNHFVLEASFTKEKIIINQDSDNMKYIEEFIAYCKHASMYGGFKVW
jgi:hypothetical protein